MGGFFDLPFFVTLVPLPPWALFLFLSVASADEVWVVARVGVRDTTAIAGILPPTWALSRAMKLGSLSSDPMPFGTSVAS